MGEISELITKTTIDLATEAANSIPGIIEEFAKMYTAGNLAKLYYLVPTAIILLLTTIFFIIVHKKLTIIPLICSCILFCFFSMGSLMTYVNLQKIKASPKAYVIEKLIGGARS